MQRGRHFSYQEVLDYSDVVRSLSSQSLDLVHAVPLGRSHVHLREAIRFGVDSGRCRTPTAPHYVHVYTDDGAQSVSDVASCTDAGGCES